MKLRQLFRVRVCHERSCSYTRAVHHGSLKSLQGILSDRTLLPNRDLVWPSVAVLSFLAVNTCMAFINLINPAVWLCDSLKHSETAQKHNCHPH